MRLRLSVLACAALAVALAAPHAHAASGAATFALIPEHYDPALHASQSYFVVDGRPGQTYTNSLRIRNLGKRTGTALLYAVDATTGQTSGAVYLDRTRPRLGVGGWVTLGARSVTLAPGRSTIVPVTVHVPAGARPGDHLGGIVAENATLTGASGRGSLQIKIRHLTIAAVLVQVPGKTRAQLQVSGVRAGGEHGFQYVYVHLKNTGAFATKPTGTLLILDASGKEVASRDLKLDTFVPRTGIDYPVLLPEQALAPGLYTGKVKLSYSAASIGYRRAGGPTLSTSGIFRFRVTSGQYKTVFQGAPPLRKPVQRATRSGSSDSTLLLVLAGALGALLVAGVALLFGMRKWSRS
jgi:hypothetical protein